MTPTVQIDSLWVSVCAILVLLMQAGFLFLETGMTRRKNSINVAAKNMADFALSVLTFWLIGFGLMFGASQIGWFGTDFFALDYQRTDQSVALFFFFQAMFCSAAVTILSGAIAERVRVGTYLLVAFVVSGFIYPVFGHWVRAGFLNADSQGWLQALGFIDFAGSTTIHSLGGWVALALLLIIGPRSGRFTTDGKPINLHRSSLSQSTMGTILLFVSWFGFNGGSALVFNDSVTQILINTLIAGCAGTLSAGLLGYAIENRIDVTQFTNGALGGLVAITAGCFAVSTPTAMFIGMVGGMVVVGLDRWLIMKRIDDVVGAVPVHLGAGIWGTLAIGLYGDLETMGTGLSRFDQIGVQLVGIFSCGIWAFGMAFILFSIVNRFWKFRVPASHERYGFNLMQYGEPEDDERTSSDEIINIGSNHDRIEQIQRG